MMLSYEHSKLRIKYLRKRLKELPQGKIVTISSHGHTYSALRISSSGSLPAKHNRYYSLNRRTGKELLPLVKEAESIKDELLSISEKIQIITRSDRKISLIKRRGEPRKMNLEFFMELKATEDSNSYPKPASAVEYKGILMRSKGEAILAQKFDALDYPCVYEPTLICGKKIHPDFAVYIPEIDKVIFIEFMGALSKSDYLYDAGEKFKFYAKNGYIIGRDVIFICETNNSAADLDMLAAQLNALIMANTEVA